MKNFIIRKIVLTVHHYKYINGQSLKFREPTAELVKLVKGRKKNFVSS